jgi:hypothetical protein
MLINISGNSFSALRSTSSNVLPTVTYNPKQIYGNDLYVWLDMTDWRTMYNSSTGSTNIPSTGYVPATSATEPTNHTTVRRLEDMAGNFTGSNSSRKFYFYANAGSGGPNINQAVPSDNLLTGNTRNVFFNNQWDSNKGIMSGTSASIFVHTLNLNNRLNFLATNSAITICSYLPQNTTFNPNVGRIGMSIDYFLNACYLGWVNNPNSFITTFRVPSGGTNMASPGITIFTTTALTTSVANGGYQGKTMMLTSVLCGRTFDIYFDNILITSGTLPLSVTYPFSSATNNAANGGIYLSTFQSIGTVPSANGTVSVFEAFIANSYTSPQQINLLYDYFRVKFKDRTYELS